MTTLLSKYYNFTHWLSFLPEIHMSGLLFENNKHTIAKVRENANRHGGKNATITKLRHW